MSNLNSLGLNGPPAETRVVVAMSGGVDSSVVAGLLKAEGYDVIGITLQLYDHGSAVDRPGSCCAGRDIHDARRVAQTLSIPHYVLDYEDRFANSVMESFADSYLAGETPIPCVTCNQQVKFKDLLETARDLGAAALATGHYIASRPVAGGWGLYRAADAERDQSYFLFATTREQLSFVRFPLGDMSKPEVRRLAGEFGLCIADKPDSQDICFVPSGGYAKVIERLRPGASKPGCIVHVDGTVLGRHDGIVNFTIGQRRGLGIAWHEPLFVIALDVAKHQVLVGPRTNLRSHWISMRDVNWLGDTALDTITEDGIEIWARIRSSQPPQAARLVVSKGRIKVCLLDGEDGVSPGQACVFYSDGSARARVLGGGWIAAVQSASECDVNGDPFQGADMALESAGVTHHQP